MNKIRFIQTDMRALWFIHPSGIKKYYPTPASYQRLEQQVVELRRELLIISILQLGGDQTKGEMK